MKKFLLYSLTAFSFFAIHTEAFAQDTPETVATPVIDPAGGPVAIGTQVAIECATEGATIYYTTDGTAPTAQSALYTEPLTINGITVVNAVAEKEGCTASETASVLFTIEDAESIDIVFDFTDHAFLQSLLGIDADHELFTTKEGKFPVQNKSYTYQDITLAFSPKGNKGAGANPRFYNNGTIVDFRFYLGQWFSVTNNTEGLFIKEITFTSNVADPFSMAAETMDQTQYDADATIGEFYEAAKQCVWVAPAQTQAVKFFNTTEEENKVTTRISTMTVSLTSKTTGVENIAIASGEKEYYNLQGVRVANPKAGNLYIVRQGRNVSKTVVR